jgi:hypothetical protein
MNNDKENKIRFRLKILSQIEPKEQAAQDAMEKVRDVLTKQEREQGGDSACVSRFVFIRRALRYSIAAAILIGIGFIAGRLAVPTQPVINMEEIQSMMDKKCSDNAEKILAASSTLMDKRVNEMIGLVEAARQKDRQLIAAAFEKIEYDRKADNNRLGNSIVALAARTNELRGFEQN